MADPTSRLMDERTGGDRAGSVAIPRFMGGTGCFIGRLFRHASLPSPPRFLAMDEMILSWDLNPLTACCTEYEVVDFVEEGKLVSLEREE